MNIANLYLKKCIKLANFSVFFEDTKFRGIRPVAAQNRQKKILDSPDKRYIVVKPIIS